MAVDSVGSVTGIALSGVRAASRTQRVSAHNVANFQTEGFAPQRARQVASPAGGAITEVEQTTEPKPVDLASERVTSSVAGTQAKASIRVLDTHLDLVGSIIDITR